MKIQTKTADKQALSTAGAIQQSKKQAKTGQIRDIGVFDAPRRAPTQRTAHRSNYVRQAAIGTAAVGIGVFGLVVLSARTAAAARQPPLAFMQGDDHLQCSQDYIAMLSRCGADVAMAIAMGLSPNRVPAESWMSLAASHCVASLRQACAHMCIDPQSAWCKY